jgi:hypothetical protein
VSSLVSRFVRFITPSTGCLLTVPNTPFYLRYAETDYYIVLASPLSILPCLSSSTSWNVFFFVKICLCGVCNLRFLLAGSVVRALSNRLEVYSHSWIHNVLLSSNIIRRISITRVKQIQVGSFRILRYHPRLLDKFNNGTDLSGLISLHSGCLRW